MNKELYIYGGLVTVGLGVGFGAGFLFAKKRYLDFAEEEIAQVKAGYRKIIAEKPSIEEAFARVEEEAHSETINAREEQERRDAAKKELLERNLSAEYVPTLDGGDFVELGTRTRDEFADAQAEENQRAFEQGRDAVDLAAQDVKDGVVNILRREQDDEAFVVREDRPYLISVGDWHDPANDRDESLNLVYYAGDDTLADESDNLIDDVDGVVGVKNLTFFGANSRAEDPDTLYVHSPVHRARYEITRVMGSYGMLVVNQNPEE